MGIRPTIGLLLSAGAAALAIAAAPNAAASSGQPCSNMGGSTQCQTTGNVQIYTTPHSLAGPKGTYGPLLGYHNGRT